MAKTKISEFSATPANNTDIDSINIAEGCAPSGINDAIRELMAQLKDFQTGAVGDSFNGPIGSTSAVTGAFTTLSATGAITSTLATGTAPFVIASTTKVANLNVDLLDGADWAAPAALGSTTPAAVSATTLSASSTVSGTGFSTYLASPPAIGGTAAAAGSFTTLSATGAVTVFNSSTNTLSLQKGDGAASILFGSNTAANGRITSIASGGLFFSTGDITQTEKMRITADGNVGVGTSSPSTKLHVVGASTLVGTVNVNSSNSIQFNGGSGKIYFGDSSSNYYPYITSPAADVISFNSNSGAERLRITTAGDVGIGTSSPATRLDVATPSGTAALISTTIVSAQRWQFGVEEVNGNYVIKNQTGGTTPVVISTGGNFGVGTTSPAGVGGALGLHVNGPSGASTSVRITNGDTGSTATDGTAIFVGNAAGAGTTSLNIYNYESSPIAMYTGGTERLRLDSAGNLGLGVTPSAWLSTSKAIQIGAQGVIEYRANATSIAMNAYYDGAWKYIGSNAASLYYQYLNSHVWNIAPSGTAGNAITFTQAMTLDASGNLGIGTTSPAVSNYRSLVMDSSVACVYMQRVSGTEEFTIYSDAGITALSTVTNPLTFSTNGSERARITSGGELLVGTTSSGIGTGRVTSYNTGGATFAAIFANTSGSSASQPIVRSYHFESNSTTSATHYEFTNRSVGIVGTIACTGSATAYNTSSDYRLKNTIAPMTGALAKVALLKPCTYKWNADGSNGEGFIAHELAEVVPQAVTGEKDAVDADGNPKYQGIDTSFLVATLTAALQEAVAEINSLKARLDAANL